MLAFLQKCKKIWLTPNSLLIHGLLFWNRTPRPDVAQCWPLIIMQKIKTIYSSLSEKMWKISIFWHLIPLNLQINFFFQIPVMSLFWFHLNFMQNFTEIWWWQITELWWTDTQTERLTDEVDYIETAFSLGGPIMVMKWSNRGNCQLLQENTLIFYLFFRVHVAS